MATNQPERTKGTPKKARRKSGDFIDWMMEQWKIGEQSIRFHASVRRVLGELSGWAQSALLDPSVQVVVLKDRRGASVWAFFPVRNRREKQHEFGYIMPKVRLNAEAQVLLVLRPAEAKRETDSFFEDCLRDHLGHTLLYLHNPLASNDCPDAWRAWRAAVTSPVTPLDRRLRKAMLAAIRTRRPYPLGVNQRPTAG